MENTIVEDLSLSKDSQEFKPEQTSLLQNEKVQVKTLCTNSFKNENQTGKPLLKENFQKKSKFNYEIDSEIIKPNDYLFLSLFTSFFCFLPLGLIALYFSIKSSKAYHCQKYLNSIHYSKLSLKINIAGLLTGFVLFVATILIFIAVLLRVIEDFNSQIFDKNA
ncbi:unnamed protein product [Brachionus calyciflorus]|uniref:Interferon-induced transmembrane protein n=1 Tax=Brachionus calyciflorus TaxID=104777 RepID=A0A814JEI8_9BILA|nr:unnamed protein product [Brachionus calyciflorus]